MSRSLMRRRATASDNAVIVWATQPRFSSKLTRTSNRVTQGILAHRAYDRSRFAERLQQGAKRGGVCGSVQQLPGQTGMRAGLSVAGQHGEGTIKFRKVAVKPL
jgi:hypothetical protein